MPADRGRAVPVAEQVLADETCPGIVAMELGVPSIEIAVPPGETQE